jgi:cell division septum initiation protein DivIVA
MTEAEELTALWDEIRKLKQQVKELTELIIEKEISEDNDPLVG